MKLTSERARELGKASGKARKAQRRDTLSLDTVEAAFGPLESIEDAQRRLERLSVWSAAGLMAGSVAGAAVRAVDVWIRAREAQLSNEVLDRLRMRIEELEGQARGQGTMSRRE